MALSDYLTSDEWDACLYMMQRGEDANFGDAMHRTIQSLLSAGYQFAGLYADGNKKQQIPGTNNGKKLCIFLGNPHNCDVAAILDNGRNFIKKHLPDLVGETDEEWNAEPPAGPDEPVIVG